MVSRIVFFVGFGVILIVAGAFLAIVLLYDDRQDSATRLLPSPVGSLVVDSEFEGRTSGWIVKGRLIETAGRNFGMEFDVRDQNGRPLPEGTRIDVTLDMAEHAMAPVRALVEPFRPGVYRASTTVSMAGRWRVRIDLPDGTYWFLTKTEM